MVTASLFSCWTPHSEKVKRNKDKKKLNMKMFTYYIFTPPPPPKKEEDLNREKNSLAKEIKKPQQKKSRPYFSFSYFHTVLPYYFD